MISFAVGFTFNLTEDNISFIFSVHYKTFLFDFKQKRCKNRTKDPCQSLIFFFFLTIQSYIRVSFLRTITFPYISGVQ